jgi:SAM-dependent methyltransferase
MLAALQAGFAGRDIVRVVDLGCGTGSNLRAVAPALPPIQHWTLVDHDRALLYAARDRVAAWADLAEVVGGDLAVTKGELQLTVTFVLTDLAVDPGGPLGPSPDLVTAAALFDLVSVAWIERFAAAVAARGTTFYAALTYNGEEDWDPPHPADPTMLAAFHAHQAGDKGFGPAAGPLATAALAAAFEAKGYGIVLSESPWRLGPQDGDLILELSRGVAEAVRETHRVKEAMIVDWLENRISGATCIVGHTDLLAFPP